MHPHTHTPDEEDLPSGWSVEMAALARRLGIDPTETKPRFTRQGPVIRVPANGGLLITNGNYPRWA